MTSHSKKEFHIQYAFEYLGTVEARNWGDAIRVAKSKWGSHIIKDVTLLEASEANENT